MATARLLEQGSLQLRANADQQEEASGGGSGGTSQAGGGGTGNGTGGPTPGSSLLDWGKNVLGVGLKIKDGIDVLSDWENYLSKKKILDYASDLKNLKAFSWADDFLNFKAEGAMSKLGVAGDLVGKWGRFAGPALAPLSIYGGMRDMINPEHDGVRGAGDRFAGAMGVVSGIGTLAMAAGLVVTPVGIGIVVGAGIIAGGWALGNMIADTEWGQAAGRTISNTASAAWNGAKDVASNAWEGTKNAVGDTVEGAKKFFSNPVSSLGGLFG
jgi:hypothetical protein